MTKYAKKKRTEQQLKLKWRDNEQRMPSIKKNMKTFLCPQKA